MEEAQETERPAAVPAAEESAGGEQPATDQQTKQIYLRTIYPLNPGIPHFVDVPQGW